MSTLFGTKRKRIKKIISTESNDNIVSTETLNNSNDNANENISTSTTASTTSTTAIAYKKNKITYYSFKELGLSKPLQTTCTNLGFKRPTAIQQEIIPLILHNHSNNIKNPILALSPTGSGKTASYVLPILEKLSIDPYGIYATIITPTRELAKQVYEQCNALGSIYKISCSLVVGGCDIVKQSCELSNYPHIVIATPGRFAYLLRQHKEGSDSVSSSSNTEIPMNNLQFLVLDEADQLLTLHSGFERDIAEIISHSHSSNNNAARQCQILLFSATMTVSLERLSQIATSTTTNGEEQYLPLTKVFIQESNNDNDTNNHENQQLTATKLPAGLVQEYIFMPSHVRDTYVVATIQQLVQNGGKAKSDTDDNKKKNKRRKRYNYNKQQEQDLTKLLTTKDDDDDDDENKLPKARSIILFCSSCERTAHLSTLLTQLHISNLPLHSLMSQQQRYNSLSRFKSRHVPILVSTDVASRGLDIPTVDLILNVELPLKAIDYIHRVGRTARAGRRGKAISFISEMDIKVLHAIEETTNIKLKECADINENDHVLPLLNIVSKASRMAKMKLLDIGFDDLVVKVKERKKNEKKARMQIRGFVRKQLLEKGDS